MPDMYLDATGTGFVSYTASNLPMGLYVDGEYIRGTPSMQTAYTSSVMITATDDMGSQTKYVTFPQVDAGGSGGSVTWMTTQADFPSSMTKGTEISSITLNATGNGAVTFTDDGNLPNGISLTAGIISGTPLNVRATETTVTFTAEDMDGNKETLTVFFPIINAASGISNPNWITTPTTTGTYTTSSNISISAEAVSVPAANGVIYSASSLPPGVILDTATGFISGTPTMAGTYTSEIKVEDATDSTFQISETLIFNVSGSSSVTWITLDTDFPSTLTVDDPISSIALDADGVGEISYDYTGTLPPGLTLAGASAIGHDLYVYVLNDGRVKEEQEILVSKVSTIVLGVVAILLGISFEGQNVAFMVGLAFAIAASVNFPILILTITWEGLTTKGAFIGGFVGLLVAVLLVILGPIVWVDILGNEKAIFPYKYPALFSVTMAFFFIILISKLDKSEKSNKRKKLFEKQFIKSYLNN